MRIISWFAMVCFLLECNVLSLLDLAGYGRTVSLTLPCVSFRAMKNGRRKADPFLCRSDIRSANQKQFSRPMTGHTPRKLPFFRRNLPHHRSARIVSPTHARLSYHLPHDLSSIIYKYFCVFSAISQIFILCPTPLQISVYRAVG